MDLFDNLMTQEKKDNQIIDKTYPEIVNVHWYGGVNKLPDDVLYMGRGSPYGNPFQLEKNEAVDKHAILLSIRLQKDKKFECQMMNDMKNKKIACFCKNKYKTIRCHLDNYAKEYSDRVKAGYWHK